MKKWLNFALLWQGQLVSILGDTIYLAVISYLVLEKTGSTMKMSMITSIGLTAKIITSLIAGAIVDNCSKKYLMVFLDMMRGAAILLAVFGIVRWNKQLFLWIVLAQMVIDVCAAIFNPTVNAVIPDIVSEETVVQANSNMTVSRFLGKILGNLIFASFFNLTFYPIFLIINGCSYLFSAVTELWIKVPNKNKAGVSRKFMESIKRGYHYVGDNEGLKCFLLLCCIMNFFLCLTEILYIPFFNSYLNGVNMYGYCMSALSVGTIISAIFTSSLKRKIDTKKWFIITSIGYFLLSAIFPFQKNIYCVVIIFTAMGYVDAIMHNIISTCLQLNTDSDFRGVVFSLYSLMNNIMKPISISIGGILGEFFNIRNVITITMILGIAVLMFCYRNKKLLKFLSLGYTKKSR